MAQSQPPVSPPPPSIPAGVARLEGPLREMLDEGMAHQRARRFREAEETYRRALAQHPDQPDALNLLATLIVAAGGAVEAVGLLRRAIKQRPEEMSFRANLAAALVVLDRIDEALAEAKTARVVAPQSTDIDMNYAGILRRLGRVDEAMALYQQIIQGSHENRNYMAELGIARCQVDLGRWDQAAAGFRDLLLREPNDPAAHVELAAMGAADAEQLQRTLALANADVMPGQTRVALAHAAARICEDLGQYDDAVGHVQAAKRLIPAAADPNALTAAVDRLIATFDAQLFDRLRGQGDPSERPVFVVGVPRAGSSLIARLLASHPQVAVAGEVPRLPQLCAGMADALALSRPYPEGARELTAEGARRLAASYLGLLDNTSRDAARVVDPLPTNFEHLGLIALLFPNARILHCRRDPLDLGLSCYLHNFPEGGVPLQQLRDIARFIKEHDRLMWHWRSVLPLSIHEVVYEELVAAPDRVLQQLVEIIGLPWDERCAATAEGSELRKILARDPVGRARYYERHIGPLRQALE
jgi:tetratricopeptide (TPR) repeat protein